MNYCVKCMLKIDENAKFCPYCGKSQEIEIPSYCLLPGTMLNGKYLIGSPIGEGGFGLIYIGRDLSLDTRVAMIQK